MTTNHETYSLHPCVPWSWRAWVVMDHASASALVRQFEQAQPDSSQLAIRSRLDNLVYSNGNRSLASLAEGRIDSGSHATVPAAIVAQRCVVRSVFSATIPGPGLCRNRYAMAGHPGDNDRILARSSAGRPAAFAILDLGQLCDSAQLFDMAVERMSRFSTAMGIQH